MPDREYEDGTAETQGKVYIEIVSAQSDLTGASLFSRVNDELLFDNDKNKNPEIQAPETVLKKALDENNTEAAYTFTADGELTVKEDRLDISYVEADLTEMEGCRTSVSFPLNDPGCVTISRSGSISAAFIVQEGRRNICVYQTPYGPIEMCVYAKKVVNHMTATGGNIYLDYAVELKGMTAQKTKMTITATMISG